MLKGKNCFITGATGGIGRHIASSMAAEGCNLFLTSRKWPELCTMSTELQNKYKVRVDYGICNLNCVEEVENTIRIVKDDYTQIDILINCAGAYIIDPLEDLSLEEYETTMNVNVRAPFLLSKAFVTGMIEQQWGRIINIASVSAYNGYKDNSLYCASKHALLGFSRALHEELKEHNVRVFSISPGATATPMGDKINREDVSTFINPEEVAKYVTFVTSFDSTMISEEIQLNRMQLPH